MIDEENMFVRYNKEMQTFVQELKLKYESSLKDAQFDAHKKIAGLIEKIAADMITEIDRKYNSDMNVFNMLNNCFKHQSKVYHAFVDFIHDFGIKNGVQSLFY